MNSALGAIPVKGGVRFAVWSGSAEKVWVSLFDGETETGRIELAREGNGVFATTVAGLKPGARYGFRADGSYLPKRGLWFDPDKLLVDPYAIEIDRPFAFSPKLSDLRGRGGDTASLVPKSVVVDLPAPIHQAPVFKPGGLVYELSVRSFSILHPEVPEAQRGTIAALAHPAVIDHLLRIGVSAVELMPIVAWIDERHLTPLGLTNAWGYNPVAFMALDPRLAPGGLAELRATVAALRKAGIGTILDLVFNHTGESDALGPTLSMRGLDARAYYRHVRGSGRLVNDTGTGNTVACDHPIVSELILDSLRHFVRHAGVDGFRFDLATVLGRVKGKFDPNAPLFRAMREDPVLADRVMIAEPWDIGPDGYRLGGFPPNFLEWNDRYRDDVRRFWRGDRGVIGALATRLAGSSDVYGQSGTVHTRTVNFIAAHDGMTLADLSRYERKHNEANGEQNRDGHNENLSWNQGVEGMSRSATVKAQRDKDARALLSTLFASRGTIMLTAGDEFGRTQSGNNNAYAQDNAITWLDWEGRDRNIETFVQMLAGIRRTTPALTDTAFFAGRPVEGTAISDVAWLSETGEPLTTDEWQDPERHRLSMLLGHGSDEHGGRLAVLFNGDRRSTSFTLPTRPAFVWKHADESGMPAIPGHVFVPGRTVVFAREEPQ